MRSRDIPLDWALGISSEAVRGGVSEDYLLSQSFIERRFGDERDQISFAQYVLLCMNTAVSVEDALHGLGQRRMEPGYSPLTVRIVDGCQTLGDAIHALTKFFSLAAPSLKMELRLDHDEAVLAVCADSHTASAARALEDNQLGWLALCFSHFLGRALPLTGVIARDPSHISLDRSHWSLGAPVTLGAVSALRFPTALLASRRVGVSGREAYWDCIRARLQAADRDPVGEWRSAGADGYALKLDELARRAGVSTSTMRRRFERDEGGFRRARQRSIVETAVSMLRTSDASVDSIAVDLGYADARSFRRFIKGATGKTPQEVREGEASPDAAAPHQAIYQRIRELAVAIDA
jgi:AraC-like DNA-binding protein